MTILLIEQGLWCLRLSAAVSFPKQTADFLSDRVHAHQCIATHSQTEKRVSKRASEEAGISTF
jgi:hypothetical protein